MDYTVIRSRRRTMALQVTQDCQVIVRAPQEISETEIQRFVSSHTQWIESHLRAQAQRRAAHPEPSAAEIELLRRRAKAELPPLIARWAPIIGVSPTGFKITSARTRFGSCSGRNSLCFSLYLMQYPPEAIEAVVVHELCHIRHKNHGAGFYREVERWLPDYKSRIRHLKS